MILRNEVKSAAFYNQGETWSFYSSRKFIYIHMGECKCYLLNQSVQDAKVQHQLREDGQQQLKQEFPTKMGMHRGLFYYKFVFKFAMTLEWNIITYKGSNNCGLLQPALIHPFQLVKQIEVFPRLLCYRSSFLLCHYRRGMRK